MTEALHCFVDSFGHPTGAYTGFATPSPGYLGGEALPGLVRVLVAFAIFLALRLTVFSTVTTLYILIR